MFTNGRVFFRSEIIINLKDICDLLTSVAFNETTNVFSADFYSNNWPQIMSNRSPLSSTLMKFLSQSLNSSLVLSLSSRGQSSKCYSMNSMVFWSALSFSASSVTEIGFKSVFDSTKSQFSITSFAIISILFYINFNLFLVRIYLKLTNYENKIVVTFD